MRARKDSPECPKCFARRWKTITKGKVFECRQCHKRVLALEVANEIK